MNRMLVLPPGKLIRDNYPEIFKQHGENIRLITLTNKQLIEQLKKKAVEEAQEMQSVVGLPSELEEYCDLMKVMMAIKQKRGFTDEQIQKVMEEKRQKKGAFEKGIYLVY